MKLFKEIWHILKRGAASERAVAVYYIVIACVFLVLFVSSLFVFSDFKTFKAAGANAVWLLRDSASQWFVHNIAQYAIAIIFAIGLLLVYARHANKDRLLRAHFRYMLVLFWIFVAIFCFELLAFKNYYTGVRLWQLPGVVKIILASFVFGEPYIKLLIAGVYIRSVYMAGKGLRSLSIGAYPDAVRDGNFWSSLVSSVFKWVLGWWLFLMCFGWFSISALWYIQSHTAKPRDFHSLTIVSSIDLSKVPLEMRLGYRAANPSPGCSGFFDSFEPQTDVIGILPVFVDKNRIVFKFDPDATAGGYCDWRLGAIRVVRRDTGKAVTGFLRSTAGWPKSFDDFCEKADLSNSMDWFVELKKISSSNSSKCFDF